jgi:hypothetical protein
MVRLLGLVLLFFSMVSVTAGQALPPAKDKAPAPPPPAVPAVATAAAEKKAEKKADAPPAPVVVEKPLPLAEIRKLIEQLGDSEFRKRDAASKALVLFGPRVLPELKQARENAEPEVRRRLDDMIPNLELAATLAPKLINLSVTKKPAKFILDEITKQTGYKMEFFAGGNEQQVYDFNLTNATFWEALDKVCNETGMILQHGYGDDRLRFNYQDSVVPHIYRDGPFRLVATGFNYNRSVDFSARPKTPTATQRSEYLNFNFTLFVEPKLPILQLGAVKVLEAYDENRVSMVPGNSGDDLDNGWGGRRFYRYGNGYRQYAQQASVNLLPTSEKARAVKYLRAVVPVTLLSEQRPEVVSDKVLTAKGKKVKFGQTHIHVEDVTETAGKQYQIRMSITEDGKDNDYTWMNSLYQRIELVDGKGNKFQSYGTSFSSAGPGNAQVTFTYGPQGGAKTGVPTKLIFYAWSTVQHQVAFEFRDLPLP